MTIKDGDDSDSSVDRVATPPPSVNGIKTKAASKELAPILPINGATNLDSDDIFNLILSSPSTHNGQVKQGVASDSVKLSNDDTALIEDLLPSLNSDNSNSASITATECPMIEDSMLGLPLDFLDSL